MINRRFIEKIYKFHNFHIEVDGHMNSYYSDNGQIFIIFFDDLDLHNEHSVDYESTIMDLITLSDSVYKHDIVEDRSKSFPYPHKSNKVKFSEFIREVVCRVYTYFVEEMNVNKDEFKYVWDLFVMDMNKILKEKLIKFIFKDKYCRPLDINLLLLPNYNKLYNIFVRDIISLGKEDYGKEKRVSITSTVRSNNFTLFNQSYDIKIVELTF